MGITSKVKDIVSSVLLQRRLYFIIDVIFDELAMLKQKDSQEDDKTNSTL